MSEFDFLTVDVLRDAELEVVLAERQPAERSIWRVPAYIFHLRHRDTGQCMGHINLRIELPVDLTRFAGHVGWAVDPPYCGHHYAERACRLILPLARQHGIRELWITCGPDNAASRRTCERLGAELVEVVDVPDDYPLPEGAIRQKCRFHLMTS